MTRYEEAIKAINDYQHGVITADKVMQDHGYIMLEALHKADIKPCYGGD